MLSTASTTPKQGEPLGVRENAIDGRFRSISTHTLCLAWWLHREGHMTRRQLRVWFAAQEMHERRRYTDRERSPGRGRRERRPSFDLGELKALVGGRGSASADAELAADIRRLRALGLVSIEPHAIHFATSADQINGVDLAGFWTMVEQMPKDRRTVPVPRRTLRALAAGFSRAATGVMIALMIRSLFWHRERGDYRIDGRTKGSWIADVFGISRRGVTDARAHLIEIGWLEPVPAKQWELNKWGARDRINVDWTPSIAVDVATGQGGETASPRRGYRAEIASPDLNQSPSLREDLKTRTLGHRPGLAGVSGRDVSGRRRPAAATTSAKLRSIEPQHLRSTGDLLDLYAQAVKAGLIQDCEADRLNFIALAERARSRARNPGGMLRWLLANRRFDYITQADEDAAVQRLREWRDGPSARSDARGLPPRTKPKARALTEDEKLVQACLRVAEQRGLSPFFVARQVRPDWTRERWDQAHAAYEAAELARYDV